MINEDDLLISGKIFKPHGLKGEMNVVCDYDSDILDQGYPVIIEMDGIFVPFYASGVRTKGHYGALLTLEGVGSKDDTAPFINKDFYLRKKDIAEYLGMDEDELVVETDLTGYKVSDVNYGYLGVVEDVLDMKEYLMLVIKGDDGEEIQVPLVDEFIVAEDIEDKEMEMNLPEGFINMNISE